VCFPARKLGFRPEAKPSRPFRNFLEDLSTCHSSLDWHFCVELSSGEDPLCWACPARSLICGIGPKVTKPVLLVDISIRRCLVQKAVRPSISALDWIAVEQITEVCTGSRRVSQEGMHGFQPGITPGRPAEEEETSDHRIRLMPSNWQVVFDRSVTRI
jgi:hypothetical protein